MKIKHDNLYKSRRHVIWAFMHTMGLTLVLFITGLIPFFNPQTDSFILNIIRVASPLLQVIVVIIAMKWMGALSTYPEDNSKNTDCKEDIRKQVIGKSDFRIIVVMSTIIVILLGFKIKFSVGDESGITERLIVNILAVVSGLLVSPDEVFAGNVNIFGVSIIEDALSDKPNLYRTLVASIVAGIFLWIAISIGVTKDINGLKQITERIIVIAAVFVVACIILNQIAINNKE